MAKEIKLDNIDPPLNKIDKQNCGESCGCDAKKEPVKAEEKKPEENDPTRFGDWQVKGRAIDF